jgi:hypothetical protein
MTTPDLGKYHFLPWLRRGIGAAIGNIDHDSLPDRAQLDVRLIIDTTLNGVVTPVSPPDTTVKVYGPGDIIGIDPNVVLRTEPRNFTSNFEPNYLAGIDFDSPDFPWLFTPAAPNGDQLRPWIALIVLKSDEFKEPSAQTVPLPSIGVTKINALQDLSETWNWAHVQLSSDAPVTQIVQSDPSHAISRLLCPRRLDPETSYEAFLVPAFDIGRKAGLGLDVSGETTSTPAWTAATPALDSAPYPLPYYYRFSFHTSDEGDFESLVRRLQPVDLPPSVGVRPMAVDQPGPHIPSAGTPLGLQGALIRVGTPPTEWKDPGRSDFQTSLQSFLNLTTSTVDNPANPNKDDPRIVPPIYGRWHAGINTVDRTRTGWLDDFNLDPRWRTAGGFGTEVVQTKRTSLLASAWQQVAGVIAANRLLRQAQLARATMSQLYVGHLQPATVTTLLRWTAPVHARILGSSKTVLAHVRRSPIPHRMFSGAFRRVTRPLGPLRRRQGAPPQQAGALLSGVNDGTLQIVPPAKPPAGTVSIEQVSDQLLQSSLVQLERIRALAEPGPVPVDRIRALAEIMWEWSGRQDGMADQFWLAAERDLLAALRAAALAKGAADPSQRWVEELAALPPHAFLERIRVMAYYIWEAAGRQPGTALDNWLKAENDLLSMLAAVAAQDLARLKAVEIGTQIRFSNLTKEAIASIPPRPGFVATLPGQSPQSTGASGAADSADGAAFRQAASELAGMLQVQQPTDPVHPPLLLDSMRTTLLARLDPTITIPRRVQAMIQISRIAWNPTDPITPIMAAPEFPQPMYVPLRDLSEEYILPGVEFIPPNSLGLLEANHAFIEAYMVGLNHEMARQLLVNHYPTDQRGSYFRQFWDVSGYVPQPGDPTDQAALQEALKDIPPIHTWPKDTPLGSNENRQNIVENNLVLVVRGELFKRYPNTIIFAGKAIIDPKDGKRKLDESDGAEKQYKHPIFGARLGTDITFFGFNLTADQALGRTADAPHGYYFGFQQVPTEPRFGLEPIEADSPVPYWAELSWKNFAESVPHDQALLSVDVIATTKVLPKPEFVGGHSKNRLQSTVFRYLLGSTRIPDFLPALTQPNDVSIQNGDNDADIFDKNVQWGKDSAQAAYILLRRPFRIMVHADRMLKHV